MNGQTEATGNLTIATVEAKAGARHSAADVKMLQQIHDHASALGADCAAADSAKSAHGRIEIKSITDDSFTLTGPAAVYGGNDIARDYFDGATNFWLKDLGPRKPCLFDHGQDSALKADVLGYAELTQTDEGVWFVAKIDRSKKYSNAVLKLAEAGVLGASTGAVPHLVQRDVMKGGRYYLKSWPIAELSFTVEPMEPRLVDVRVLKSLAANDPKLAALKGFWTEAPEGSYEDLIADLGEALRARGQYNASVIATFPGYCVVCAYEADGLDMEQQFYRYDYTLDAMGEPMLGDPTEIAAPFEPSAIENIEPSGGKNQALQSAATGEQQRAAEKALAKLALLTLGD